MDGDPNTPVQYLKGVGPKLAKILSKLGIHTIGDLIFYFPRDWQDRRSIKPIAKLAAGESQIIRARISKIKEERTRRGVSILKVSIFDGSGALEAVWFNQPYLKNFFQKNESKEMLISGRLEYSPYSRRLEFQVRDYEFIESGEEIMRIAPKYSLTEGIFQKKLRGLVKSALEKYLPKVRDILPYRLKFLERLPDLQPSIYNLHFPSDEKILEKSRHRLAFDDFFVFQLGLALKKEELVEDKPGIAFRAEGPLLKNFEGWLPFKLTLAQIRVLEDIKKDMENPRPMNRLLQGDVGSGKTVVALEAALIAVQNGYQAALMAPTEILAQQHHFKISALVKPLAVEVEILTSGLGSRVKGQVLKKLKEGEVKIIIGTHALIEEGIEFKNLGLAIIDEQHKFGVIQRAALKQKSHNPDLLVMTATPIPRTLALTLYGDLDRSIIDEMPPGRIPIKTVFKFERQRAEVYDFMREQINSGRQVYVVCPLIEESEILDLKAAKETAGRLEKEVFPDFKVMLLHGRMKSEEKEKTMKDFKEGKTDILVSTTVIEVGIDIPNATMMVIEQAERFGLSQLHQLRGRIGRGSEQSYCILVGNPKSDESKQRLRAMLRSQNGFELAEVDLRLRGPGEFYGVRQSGLPQFRVADIIKDEPILRAARRAAFKLIEEDPRLEKPEHRGLKEELFGRYGKFLGLGALN